MLTVVFFLLLILARGKMEAYVLKMEVYVRIVRICVCRIVVSYDFEYTVGENYKLL